MGLTKAEDRTKYSRSWSGSVARIAIKSGASARRALGHRQKCQFAADKFFPKGGNPKTGHPTSAPGPPHCQKIVSDQISGDAQARFIRMKSASKKRTPSIVNLTVKRRYLTERQV